MSVRIRRIIVALVLLGALAGCNPNIFDYIVSNPGHCAGEQVGMPCNK